MFSKKDLGQHRSCCRVKNSVAKMGKTQRRQAVQSHAACLLPISAASNRCQDIVNSMRQDDVSFHIRSDSLICSYGESLYSKHGHIKSRHQYIAQRMRQLGQLLLAAKEISNSVSGLKDLCTPSKFQLVLQAAKWLAIFSPRKNEFGKPSKVVKIRFCLKGAVQVLIGQILINDDDLAETKAKTSWKFLTEIRRTVSLGVLIKQLKKKGGIKKMTSHLPKM